MPTLNPLSEVWPLDDGLHDFHGQRSQMFLHSISWVRHKLLSLKLVIAVCTEYTLRLQYTVLVFNIMNERKCDTVLE